MRGKAQRFFIKRKYSEYEFEIRTFHGSRYFVWACCAWEFERQFGKLGLKLNQEKEFSIQIIPIKKGK